ncbi:MAG: MFS transporter [Planctomycetota bacterium]
MNENAQDSSMTAKLSIMMFLQFFAWGAWFATLGLAMGNGALGDFTANAYATAPIAAIFAPLFLGLIADRFFSSEKVFGVLMLIGGGIMCMIPIVGAQGAESGNLFVWLILAYMVCYMPTLGLGNTIAFTHIPSQDKFPVIRVWGTIGWIVAGLLIGITGWDGSFTIFWLGAICSLALGVYCFMLPNTPPPLRGKPMDIRNIFMLDAFKLLGDFNFLVFAVCSTLICIPLAFYYGSTSQFLGQTGFAAVGATMTIGQMSEIIFMLLIPFFFRTLGIKVMILIGMACWSIRYLLFAFGAPDQTTWMLLLAVALHGICYDFFFVTGFMYTDQKAPKEIRGQAQALLVFLTQGVGMFIGYKIMGNDLFGWSATIGDYGKSVSNAKEFGDALTESQSGESLSFLETFGSMFTRSLPEGLNQELLTSTMAQWKDFWLSPAIMAAVILVGFAIAFWDKAKDSKDDEAANAE